MARNRIRRPVILGALAALAVSSCGRRKVSVPAPPTRTTSTRQVASAEEPVQETDQTAPTDAPSLRSGRDLPPPLESEGVHAPIIDKAGIDTFRQGIVETVLAQIGIPYRWGGTSPTEGFDCSGLVQWTFAQQGVSIPRSTREQFQIGRKVDRKQIAPGDLLFYAWGSDPRSVIHVGIYVGYDNYVHSPRSGKRCNEQPLRRLPPQAFSGSSQDPAA